MLAFLLLLLFQTVLLTHSHTLGLPPLILSVLLILTQELNLWKMTQRYHTHPTLPLLQILLFIPLKFQLVSLVALLALLRSSKTISRLKDYEELYQLYSKISNGNILVK